MAVGLASVIALALAAGIAEIATMLPYIAAIGLLSTSELALPLAIALLAAYCAVMLLPATVLLAMRIGGGRRVDAVLTKIGRWFSRSGSSLLAWAVGIVGVILIVHNLRVVVPGAN